MRYIELTIFTVFLLISSGCANVLEDYTSAVKLNDTIYLGSGDIISEDEVGSKIGSISKNASKFPKKDGEANAYLAGTNFFEVKGLSKNKTIAIEKWEVQNIQ
jgi:hypothetical protein